MAEASERSLERWSRAHALALSGAALVAAWLGALWPIAWEAVLAFPALILLDRRRATPSGRFGLANTVTALRLALVLWLTVSGNQLDHWLVAGVALGVFALDGLDGWLARVRHEQSELGAHFDMETDALFVLITSCLLLGAQRAGDWILLAGAFRYLWVLATWAFPPPRQAASRSRLGRYIFSFFVSSAIACFVFPPPFAVPLSALATAALTFSFARSTLGAYGSS